MNVTRKEDIEQAVKFLKAAAENEEDWRKRSALVNVSCVLEQALGEYHEDEQHPHLYLEIVKAKNLLDQAIDDCCNTDCIHFCKGTCPFPSVDGKCKCPTIDRYLDS